MTTQPTALIVLDGPPRYASVVGTTLQYAANTSAHLFRDGASSELYVRVGGLWFRAADVNGSWAHVPAASLPAAFSTRIGSESQKPLAIAVVGGMLMTLFLANLVPILYSFYGHRVPPAGAGDLSH